jgi:hypothetical protein
MRSTSIDLTPVRLQIGEIPCIERCHGPWASAALCLERSPPAAPCYHRREIPSASGRPQAFFPAVSCLGPRPPLTGLPVAWASPLYLDPLQPSRRQLLASASSMASYLLLFFHLTHRIAHPSSQLIVIKFPPKFPTSFQSIICRWRANSVSLVVVVQQYPCSFLHSISVDSLWLRCLACVSNIGR